jgi:hypothetical protein
VTIRWQGGAAGRPQALRPEHVQFVLLASLTWPTGDEPVTQRDLAAHAAADPMLTSQVPRVLEQRAVVRRSAHPVDGRARAGARRRGLGVAHRSRKKHAGLILLQRRATLAEWPPSPTSLPT